VAKLGYDVLASENSVLSLWRVVSVAGCLGYDVLVYWPAQDYETPELPAHHNLNNQQLKLFVFPDVVPDDFPAHHNLNNQQLKLIV
jgi:hypothetical protein